MRYPSISTALNRRFLFKWAIFSSNFKDQLVVLVLLNINGKIGELSSIGHVAIPVDLEKFLAQEVNSNILQKYILNVFIFSKHFV